MLDVKSPKKSTGNASNGLNAGSFVSCEISDKQKAFIKENILDDATILDHVLTLVSSGHKVSFSWDNQSDCCAVFATGTGSNCDNKGLTLSARGPNVGAAATVLFYKHFEILKEDWHTAKISGQKDVWG